MSKEHTPITIRNGLTHGCGISLKAIGWYSFSESRICKSTMSPKVTQGRNIKHYFNLMGTPES